jgi:hypothetical protein
VDHPGEGGKLTALCILAAGTLISGTNIAALVSNANARAWATQTVQGSNVTVTLTNTYPAVGSADPSGLTWLSYGTNGLPTTNAYRVAVETNITHDLTDWPSGYTWTIDPPRLVWQQHTLNASNRFVWGPYSNIVVSGMLSGARDGTYLWSERVPAIIRPGLLISGPVGWDIVEQIGGVWRFYALVDIYTNGASCVLADYGPMLGRMRSERLPRHIASANQFQGSMGSAFAFPTAATTYVNPSAVDDFYARRGLPISFPWATITNGPEVIDYDWTYRAVATPGTLLTNYFRDCPFWSWTAPAVTTSGTIIDFYESADSLDSLAGKPEAVSMYSAAVAVFNNSAPYLSTNDATAGEFEGYTNANQFAYLPSTNCYLDHVWDASTNLVLITNATVYSTNVLNATSARAEAMRWTRDTTSWTAGGETNAYTYTGTAAAWADAIAAAQVATASGSISDGAPYARTEGTLVGTTYTARYLVRKARQVRSGYWTGKSRETDFYVRGAADGVWQDYGATDLVENEFVRYDQSGVGSGGSTTSDWVSADTTAPAGDWCAEPSVGAPTKSGWTATGLAVTKWEF